MGQGLYEFMRGAWHIIEEGNTFIPNWHIEVLCEFGELVCRREITRLCITIPPRMAKSLTWSVFMHPWAWGELDPSLRFLFTSYSNSLARRDSKRARDVINSIWYQDRYGKRFQLKPDQNTQQHYVNTRGGERISVGLHGSITGEGANIIVVDDPHNIDERRSDAKREAAKKIFNGSVTNRLNDPNRDAIVVIQQRIHGDDLAGEVIEEDGYLELRMPNEYDPTTSRMVCVNEDGEYVNHPSDEEPPDEWDVHYDDPREDEGELLFPERLGMGPTAERKEKMGEEYYAIYQQDPASGEMVLFKEGDWNYWRTKDDWPYRWQYLVHSWDLAFKKGEVSGFVVGMVVGFFRGDYYILHVYRKQCGYIESKAAIRAMMEGEYGDYDEVLIEDKANGTAAIEELRDEGNGGIVAVEPQESKEVRASKAATRQRSGNVYVPHPEVHPWCQDMLHRFRKFPSVDAADEIDAFSQAVIYLRRMESRVNEEYEAFQR